MSLLTRLLFLAATGCLMFDTAAGQPMATNAPATMVSPGLAGDSIVLPAGISDPIEPFNRAMWGFDEGLMKSVVRPASTVYRHVVVKPVRTGIGNMGKNLTYPDRLVNNLLQGNWMGMGDETERCLFNTLFGLGGFFDVATHWGIPKADADFGQTFRKWGWQPDFFLMLPVLGPNDDCDTTGLVGDTAANPLTYFFPYDWIGTGVAANNFSDSVEGAVRFSQTEADSYSILEYGWSFAHENRPVDWRVTGGKDEAALETLHSFFFNYHNPAFPARGRTRPVFIPATGKKLDFTFWLQPGRAPVVYIVPGFGAHRLDQNVLALAELVYQKGFSAVCISSSFHPEFMEHASSTDLPSYPPIGVHDVHVALTEIDHQLDQSYPHRLGARALMGYSMGGFQTLFLAATAATNAAPLLKFERYVAIDAPVRLRYCVTNADQFYQAPLAWPAGERTADIENTLLKVAALVAHPPAPDAALPFNAIESRFLIGLSFRLTLRDIIFSSQLRHNQGVLQQPLKKSRRRAAYDEIMRYSFWDYIQQFASRYDAVRGIDIRKPEVVAQGTDLRAHTAGLQGNPNIRIIANRNDIFLAAEDLAWIETTFPPAQARLFEQGGHMGNLFQPAVQQAILDSLEGLKGDAREIQKTGDMKSP